jgi:glycosyltransferase involved in cell wall biosynthesis
VRRITHIVSSPAGFGGAELLVSALARDACSRGDDVEVLLPFRDAGADRTFVDACAPARVHERIGPSLRGVLAARGWVARHLRRHRPDVVHTHLASALVIGAVLPRRLTPVLVTTHHHGDLWRIQGRRFASQVETLALRRYDLVVAVSGNVAEHLGQVAHIPSARIRVIVNGWVGSPLAPKPAAPPRVVCVGRLRPEKGQAVLLEAFAHVREQRPEVRLDLVGDGPERSSLARDVRRLKLDSAVEFHGDVRDVWPFLQSATVAVQPSLVEQFGISAVEAMAASVPVVATATGGLGPMVADSRAGLVVPPGDPEALAVAMLRVLDDTDLRTELAEAGPRYAAGLRLDRTLEAYARLYDDLGRLGGG